MFISFSFQVTQIESGGNGKYLPRCPAHIILYIQLDIKSEDIQNIYTINASVVLFAHTRTLAINNCLH